ncbi:heme exporter protein CcmD [Chenggangzhangella methanolivorans]|uniref:Heme exporter protein D n=1 Tax=Chenggangzhangella methanolivorans TaxID=1437009 RepID=A0A9E6RDI6_9HYPH|nr:heme exporter protein CcmD [Chenggangzhangella methanolivorans]QZO01890.1 heme exporter protein CcmD [Chenggangzhangella methanolivorans]
MTGPHFGFIAASYGIGFVVVAGLILWTWVDHRVQTRALKALEAANPRRRSAR